MLGLRRSATEKLENREFFGVWERVKSHIEQGRKMWNSKTFLSQIEKRRSVSRRGMRLATQGTSPPCAI
jgi:hypothetical protein